MLEDGRQCLGSFPAISPHWARNAWQYQLEIREESCQYPARRKEKRKA